MRGWVSILAAAWMGVILSGCAEPQAPGRPWAGWVHPDVLAKAGLQYYWTYRVSLAPGENVIRLYQLDENLYCLTDRNRLIAVDALRGIEKWSFVVATAEQTVFRPAHADDAVLPEKVSGILEILKPEKIQKNVAFKAVVINSLSHAYVLNRTTGKVIREVPLGFAANTGCAIDPDGQFLIVGATTGQFHAFRLSENVHVWAEGTGALLTAPLEYFSGRVYAAGEDKVFRSVRVSEGVQEWAYRAAGPITAPFHVDNRGCFVACEDNRVYAFAPLSGLLLWPPFVCQGTLRDPIQVGERSIFQYARLDKFYAVNLATGQERWSKPEGRLVLAVLGGNVYLLDNEGTLRIVDENLGEVRTSFPMTGFELFVGNTTAPAVYAGTYDGRLACIRLLADGHLTPEMMKPAVTATPQPPAKK